MGTTDSYRGVIDYLLSNLSCFSVNILGMDLFTIQVNSIDIVSSSIIDLTVTTKLSIDSKSCHDVFDIINTVDITTRYSKRSRFSSYCVIHQISIDTSLNDINQSGHSRDDIRTSTSDSGNATIDGLRESMRTTNRDCLIIDRQGHQRFHLGDSGKSFLLFTVDTSCTYVVCVCDIPYLVVSAMEDVERDLIDQIQHVTYIVGSVTRE